MWEAINSPSDFYVDETMCVNEVREVVFGEKQIWENIDLDSEVFIFGWVFHWSSEVEILTSVKEDFSLSVETTSFITILEVVISDVQVDLLLA